MSPRPLGERCKARFPKLTGKYAGRTLVCTRHARHEEEDDPFHEDDEIDPEGTPRWTSEQAEKSAVETWEQEGRDWLYNFADDRGRRARVMPFGRGWEVKVFGGDGEEAVVDGKLFARQDDLEAAKRWAEERVKGGGC